jgi:capsular exopolysaccharide synthesis family protein
MSRIYDGLQRSGLDSGFAVAFSEDSAFKPLETTVASPPEDLHSSVSVQPLLLQVDCLPAVTQISSYAAEQFRILDTSLQHLRKVRSLKTILLTSTTFGEGKTLVSANLAFTMAQHGRILLVEGDLRKPGLGRLFGLPELRGVFDWYTSKEPFTKFLYRLGDLNIWFLPAGIQQEASSIQAVEIMQSPRSAELLKQLGEAFDWVLIDSAPLPHLVETTVLSRLTDGTLFVVRQGKTSTKLLQNALERVEERKLLGLVLNDSSSVGRQGYERYYRS